MKYINVIIFNWLIIFFYHIKTINAIIGGSKANSFQFKYQVSVQKGNKHICGGGIIKEEYVLTAANCFVNENDEFINEKYTVIYGVFNLIAPLEQFEIDVAKVYVPREFKRTNPNPRNTQFLVTGDIAVIKLAHKILLDGNPFLSKLSIPEARKYNLRHKNKQATIAGFGIETLTDRVQQNTDQNVNNQVLKLKFAKAVILHHRTCERLVTQSIDSQKHTCAQIVQNTEQLSEGTCDGDVGSPLVKDEDNLIGILSTIAAQCDERQSASIYTRIIHYLSFIENSMNGITTDIRVANYQGRQVIEEVTNFNDLMHFPQSSNFVFQD